MTNGVISYAMEFPEFQFMYGVSIDHESTSVYIGGQLNRAPNNSAWAILGLPGLTQSNGFVDTGL